jgi:hypothetical protein
LQYLKPEIIIPSQLLSGHAIELAAEEFALARRIIFTKKSNISTLAVAKPGAGLKNKHFNGSI